jgi:hypothetical protein|nr:MAG TPA: hypothetical protein [Caudoviricetes sp.]
MNEIKIRPIVELLKVLRDNTDKIVLWQSPLDGVDELTVFHKLFSREEKYILKCLLVEWGVKPDKYVVEPIWNILDKIIEYETKR